MNPSIYRLRLQDILVLCVLCLLFLGVIMVQSAAMNLTGSAEWHWTQRGTMHVIFAAIGLVTFFAVGHIDYDLLARGKGVRVPVLWMLAIAVFTCVIVLVPGIGREVNGARRWLPLGFTQVQPSELAKWGVILFVAWWLAKTPVNVRNFIGFIITLVPVGAVCLLVVIEDFGTAALIGLSTLMLLVAGRVKIWHLAITVPPALAAGAWFVMHEPYRWKRMTAFVDPFAAPRGEGYHMIQSLLSFATGGIFGKGLGRGIQKLGYLPEDTTDFIFAVICEELGIFGALLTVAMYLGVLYVAWQAVKEKRDDFGRLLGIQQAIRDKKVAGLRIRSRLDEIGFGRVEQA